MRNLKKYFILLACICTVTIMGCSENDEENETSSGTPIGIVTSADNTGLTFAKSGGSQDLHVQAAGKVEITSDAAWCKVVEAPTASTKLQKFTVTVETNTETSDRTAVITVKAGTTTKTVDVFQTAADGLIVTTTSFDVKAEGETIVVKYSTNGEPDVTIDVDWIKQSVNGRANMQDKTLQFDVKANYTEERTGKITFTLNNLTETVTIKQVAMELSGTDMANDALALAAKMYTGINIGNTMEVPDGETAWGNPKVNVAYIEAVKAAGFNAIRIPCAWDSYIVDAANYTIDANWLNRVDEVVGYCVANDLYAIVNIHWDGGWLENNCTPDKQEANNKKQKALWTQIANKLNHYDEHVLFAGCNEPNVGNAEQWAVLKSYEQTFVDAVRATGGNNAVRNLIVQGPTTDINTTVSLFEMPEDVVPNRLLVEVHYYDPYQFTIMNADESWGKVHYFWGDYCVDGSDRNSPHKPADIISQFQKMKNQFVDKGIPVILGEYGVSVRNAGADQEAHDKSRQQWNEVVTREAKNHGLVPFLWDTGGLLNRNNGTLKDNYVMDGVAKGASEGKYPF